MDRAARSVLSRPSPALLSGMAVLAGLATLAVAAPPAPGRAGTTRAAGAAAARPAAAQAAQDAVRLAGPWQTEYRLRAGETVEIAVALDRPGSLPANGRVAVAWRLAGEPAAASVPAGGDAALPAPTAGWRKVLHALDGSVYLLYRAPIAGRYQLSLEPVVDEVPVGGGARWREKGTAPDLFPLPRRTPWPAGTVVPVTVRVNPVDTGTEEQAQRLGTLLETEPNDAPELAVPLTLVPAGDVRTYEVTGTADDIEYFDNGQVGKTGDDWYRVEVKGTAPRLVTAHLGIPGQFVAARVRTYRLEEGSPARVPFGGRLAVKEWSGAVNSQRLPYTEGKPAEVPEGKDPNERAHQQEEEHRLSISRIMEPGRVYFLRVEANAPGYQLQVRVLPPAPYTDPRLAVRQAMYNHIGQVDSWLSNRPRGASVERRIRDTGNLLGTQCMSCHTQSGVWGPAVPIRYGYRVENVISEWHLLNVMYECLRPTNVLKDAANNTSLAPLDIGDGPAGTRAAGFNIVNAEGNFPPRKLHAKQQIRTANFVLLTADPGGINAAGPGSNIGRNIVWLFASEILHTAWQRTGDPKYFRALEDKARLVLGLDPKFTDDVGVRMDYFGRVFPLADYPAQAAKAAEAERAAGQPVKGTPADAEAFVTRVRTQLAADEARIRATQNPDGTWGFSPGTSRDGGKTWTTPDHEWDPSPTALALIGLGAVGHKPEDPAIARGVQALLRIQDPNGRWNRAAITGFVPTAYVLRALGRLFPVKPYVPRREEFLPVPGESTLAAVKRVQALALTGEPRFADLLLQAAKHPSTAVRWWALVGLGGAHVEAGVPVLLRALREPARPLREAAAWALKQTLLDDHGWEAVFTALERGDDYTREGVVQALGIRADAVMPRARLDWNRLNRALAHAMNRDPHPAVRAWAGKAAWQWWIWNPPVRAAINDAWVEMMARTESSALVENSNRYSSQALFIANGHKANGSDDHQYKELAQLFDLLRRRLEGADPAVKSLLSRRLVSVAGTFYQTAGGDGGPGQLGYVTPGAGALVGQAVVVYLRGTPENDIPGLRAGLEGAANVPHGPLQEHLLNFALKAPEELRREAAAALSDPRSAMLQAATELVEPLIAQVKRGAAEPARRGTLSDPVVKLFATVNWVIPEDAEQQRHFFDLIIPRFDRYASPDELAAMTDAARRAELEREMEAAWYLADRLGEVLATNPDLHKEIVVRRYFPAQFRNPLERHFWVRSVPWILERGEARTEIGAAAAAEQRDDPDDAVRDRALRLFVEALQAGTLPLTRAAAVRVANSAALRRSPEVLDAFAELLRFEKDPKLREIAQNVLKLRPEAFLASMVAALREERRPGRWLTAEGQPEPTFLADLLYYRDYVVPELAGVKRSDQMACMSCHGKRGRVPSFFLRPVDDYGFLSSPDLLNNYREMQSRVSLSEPERSKILRKPLNVQDGTEDGHQGGRRYLPQDEGYLILKRWVENQPRVQAAAAATAGPAPPE